MIKKKKNINQHFYQQIIYQFIPQCQLQTEKKLNFYISPEISREIKKVNFKKIGLSKYYDLEKPISLHFNKEYKQEYSKNPGIFKYYKGIFSGMYENAIRNGNIYPPFDNKLIRERNKKLI